MRLEHSNEQKGQPSTNGSSQNRSSSHTNGETNGYHNHGSPQAIASNTSAFRGLNREEITRILLQSLSDLGFRGTAEQLSKESGYQLEIPSVAAFRSAVLLGEWDEAEALLFGSETADLDGGVSLENGHTESPWQRSRLSVSSANGYGKHGLPLANGAETVSLRFLLRQQKYLESLESRDLGGALHILRNELTPLKRDTGRLHALSALMMCTSAEDLRARADWDGASGESRNQLLSEISESISPSVMIPEHRLATLLNAVQREQVLQCKYHNTVAPPSLYTDHECSADDFPLQALTELRNHSDEVWFVKFSHDGKLLATAGKDGLVTIYDTTRWKVLHEFREHERNTITSEKRGVCYVAFSPDNQLLITCSMSNEFAVMNVADGRVVARADHFDYPVSAAAWLPDSQTFVVGTQSSARPLGLYSMRPAHSSSSGVIWNNEIHSWRDPPWEPKLKDNPSAFRVADVAVSSDGTRMVATTIQNKIMVYNLETRAKIAEWVMEDKLMSINFSRDGTALLITMNEGKVWALDSVTGEIIMRYKGAKQEQWVIRSCFGGAGENFVLSGSEDSRVYIWRRQSGLPIATLEAHAPGTVNAVAWHPTNPAIFASAGDDRRVRIWTSANALRNQSATEGVSGPGTGLYSYAR